MRVTCGSAVISHEGKSESPSPEESDCKDEVAFDSGGKMRNLRVLERQRGVGMESFRNREGNLAPAFEHLNQTYQPGSTLRARQIGYHHTDTSHEKKYVLLAH